MITCHCCRSEKPVDETYFISLLPSFTYYDAVLCKDCVALLGELLMAPHGKKITPIFEDWVQDVDPDFPPECGFYLSRYDEILDAITRNVLRDEKVCPYCGGISAWAVEELDTIDENGEPDLGEVIYFCLNCGKTDPPDKKCSFWRDAGEIEEISKEMRKSSQ